MPELKKNALSYPNSMTLAGSTDTDKLDDWKRDARRLGVPVVPLPVVGDAAMDERVLEQLDSELAREFRIFPLGVDPDGVMELAAAFPSEALQRLGDLEFILGKVRIVAAEPSGVLGLISRYYGQGDLEPSGQMAADRVKPEWSASGGEAGVAGYVDRVIEYACRVGASDVHFEPHSGGFTVRLRVDGQLRPLPGLPGSAGASVIARLKVLAGLDIGEGRRAQDGRIRADYSGIDLRLATLPTVNGECAVLRILAQVGAVLGCEELGMPQGCRDAFSEVARSHGLVLVCGPTGSGKTTSLHAMLRSLDSGDRKILTIEDPVEYELPGAVQVHARPEIDLGFARALRSFLRHDPDIILVGEIRDAETARIALRSAITGHLVLASLHCHDAVSAPLRLMDLGLESWLVATALELSIAQRLFPRRCTACGGQGCEECMQSGARGRAAVFEWLRMEPVLASHLDASDVGTYMKMARSRVPVTMSDEEQRLLKSGIIL